MAVKTRIDSIAADINLFISAMLSPDAQSAAIADFARGAISEADETNRSVLGRVPPRVVTVDGNRGAALETVRPVGGSIIVEWELIGDVMMWIGLTLRNRSPTGPSGNYRDSHTLFADGKEVAIGDEVPIAEEYVFLNPVPYARKIEIGKTKSGRDFVVKVPNRIYQRTADDAKARFGKIVNLKFSYRAPEDFGLLKYVPVVRTTGRDKNGRITSGQSAGNAAAAAHERSLRVPAIVITTRAV